LAKINKRCPVFLPRRRRNEWILRTVSFMRWRTIIRALHYSEDYDEHDFITYKDL
jgi:hypothetical protein